MDSYGLAPRRQESLATEHGLPEHSLVERNSFVRRIRLTPVQQTVLILQRHIWTIVACVLIVTSLSLLWAARQPRLYCATSKIAIYRDSQTSISPGKDAMQQAGDTDEYNVSLETQLHILQSRTLALAVVRKLGLTNNPGFAGKEQSDTGTGSTVGSQDPSPAESAAVDAFLLGLSVHPVKDTRVVEVGFTGPKAELDAQIVNALVDGFIEDSIRSRYDAATRAGKFLSGQLADLRTKVQDSQEKLIAYEREHNIVGVDEK